MVVNTVPGTVFTRLQFLHNLIGLIS